MQFVWPILLYSSQVIVWISNRWDMSQQVSSRQIASCNPSRIIAGDHVREEALAMFLFVENEILKYL